MSKTILITGATGKQGGAVINALLAARANVNILAVTRDANSPSAKKLAQKSSNIKLITGDLNRVEDIFKKAKEIASTPVWGVFSVQIPSTKANDDTEERQGKALIDAALKNSIKHFTYTSVDRGGDSSRNNPTNVPHFITKHNIEQHLFHKTKDTDMAFTILRPVAFLDNLTPTFFGKVFATANVLVLEDKPLQLIATSDIGYFAAQSFINSDEWRNRSISLAGDELNAAQMSRIFKQKTGRDIPTTYKFLASIILWLVKDFGLMYKFFDSEGYKADIKELRQMHPELKDFGTWLEKESQFETR